ncbi:HEAT repeat domain-containing protein [Halorubrum rubrum]|uniref:HEAT repeat domain-containing protein n=1 Tax=Halorubrum rubrum TaxID=1126240 RepID=A0ABD5QY63_9EURY|nr:HEAT repeat domain-containing protein [Halorubrum rubrum]
MYASASRTVGVPPDPGPPVGTAQVDLPSLAVSIGIVVLGSLLVSAVLVTVGYSLLAARRRRRREPVRADLRSELLERLYGREDPGWETWAASLSAARRDELRSLLDVYLRRIEGRDAERLARLGAALGIPERSRREIRDGDYWDRLDALTWLALLRDPPDRALLEARCTDTPRERAAAVRVLYASDAPDLATTGVDLLLGDDPSAFSVFGIDTLYRVGETDPGPLFDRAAAEFDGWDPAVQQQVLSVTGHLHTVVGDADLSWVVGAVSSPEERVRVAAWRALAAYGWNAPLRARIDPTAALDDPSPVVRASAYRLLGAWGDAEALSALRTVAAAEPDGRTRVAAAEALLSHRGRGGGRSLEFPAGLGSEPPGGPESASPGGLADAWAWAVEHARFDDLARDVPRRGALGHGTASRGSEGSSR